MKDGKILTARIMQTLLSMHQLFPKTLCLKPIQEEEEEDHDLDVVPADAAVAADNRIALRMEIVPQDLGVVLLRVDLVGTHSLNASKGIHKEPRVSAGWERKT